MIFFEEGTAGMDDLQIIKEHIYIALVAAIYVKIAAFGDGNGVDGVCPGLVGVIADGAEAAGTGLWAELVVEEDPVDVGFGFGGRSGDVSIQPTGQRCCGG